MTSKLIERLINKEYLTERERKEWLNNIKEHIEVLEYSLKLKQDAIDSLTVANELLSNRANVLNQENEKLKKVIENEIEILIERRFNAYACDDYETHNVLNTIIEELREVLG